MTQEADALDDLLAQAESFDSVETVQAEGEAMQLTLLLKKSAEFMIEFFLGDSLDLPVPQVHKDIWALLTDMMKERVLLAIPRDHAKTTLAKLFVIWCWLFTSHRFCVYLSNTNAIAKGACKDIIGFIRHPNFVALFGKADFIKESEQESLWIFDLTVGGKKKRCILRAVGQGQQMRGINIDNQRPDLAVVDDVEDNENTDSATLQLKLDKWIFGPFLKALARKKKIVWLGNMLQKTSLLARLSRRPNWNPVVFGCLVKDPETHQLQPLWPGKWTVESLKEDFKEYKDLGLIESWMCEMMNMPGHGENGFTQDQINYVPTPTPDDVKAAWITVDPAFGLNAWNDESSIAVHVLPESGCPRTVQVVHGRWTEMEMFLHILSLAEYWNAWAWGIESVAAQKLLITLFNVFLAQRQMPNRALMVPLMSGRGDPKLSRIKALAGLMKDGEWGISEDDVDFTTQFLDLDFKKKDQADDIVDSVAYGPSMMNDYLAAIMAQFQGSQSHFGGRFMSELEICDV